MKVITCVGYHATGSGAVDDFLREFDNIESAKYGVECRFLQDPDGIFDLEYNLVHNPNRLNSGFAIKRFLKLAYSEKRSYERIFGKEWIKWVNDYINSLSNFIYNGYWRADIRLFNPLKRLFYYFRRAINLLVPKKMQKNKYYNYFPNEKTYFSNIDENRFLDITRNSIDKLCSNLNINNKEYVVLDQAVSPQNVDKYLRYFNDIKVIIVDRDPRDVYINDVIINKDFVLPKDVKQFCDVYRFSRKSINVFSENVLKINFEDMVYDYENTSIKIMNFLNLNKKNHKFIKKYFDPDCSKKNTNLWKKHSELSNEIKFIENELSEFLYEK